jgi:hypothetical protein
LVIRGVYTVKYVCFEVVRFPCFVTVRRRVRVEASGLTTQDVIICCLFRNNANTRGRWRIVMDQWWMMISKVKWRNSEEHPLQCQSDLCWAEAQSIPKVS